MTSQEPTAPAARPALGTSASTPSVRLTFLRGPDSGRSHETANVRTSIGSHPSNDLVLSGATISRFHCELVRESLGVRIRDLGSRNGTVLDGVPVLEAWLRDGSTIEVGDLALRAHLSADQRPLVLSAEERFGDLVGRSVAMRAAFARLELAARSDSTVLLTGETGTGKELAAQALHDASARRDGPFVVVDCGALPEQLVESELFGHERGAFTGAVAPRAGAFEAAQGGTVFLDEIGELPLAAQPKLLRVIEQRSVQRIGSSTRRPVDVRIVAATHRDLRVEVNGHRFRSDLYYRLAVVQIELPPLRSRPEDLALLVPRILDRLGASEAERERLSAPEHLSRLRRSAWTGNVRELRNHLETALVLAEAAEPPGERASRDDASRELDVDTRVGFAEARRKALASFERAYLGALLAEHDGNVARAAEVAGVDRTYIYRLLRRRR